MCCRNRTSYENFQLKLCSCAQSHALGTRTKFQFEIMTLNVITCIVYFLEIILESSRNVSETTPGLATGCHRDVRRGGLSSCFCMLLHFLEISCKRQLGMLFWQNGKHMVSLFFYSFCACVFVYGLIRRNMIIPFFRHIFTSHIVLHYCL